MNIIHGNKGLLACLAMALSFSSLAQNPSPPQGNFPPPRQNYEIQTPTYLSDYFEESTAPSKAPNEEGFIQRWMLLEPISKPNRSNVVFTDSYLNHVLDSIYFKDQFTVLPKDGAKVKVGKQKLQWHALDSKLYNVKLYRLAAALKKPVYGVIFWAVTVIDKFQGQGIGITLFFAICVVEHEFWVYCS